MNTWTTSIIRTAAAALAGAALCVGLLPATAQAATPTFRVSITKIADRSVPQNWDLVVSAKVSPTRQAKRATVTVQASADGRVWQTIKTSRLSSTAGLSKVKVSTGKLSVGSWRVRVCKGAGKGYQTGCSAPAGVTIQAKPKFGVSLSIADRTLNPGQHLAVSGKASPASQAKNSTVAVQASADGASWRTVKTVKLNSKATFSTAKITTGLAAGAWQLRACKYSNSHYQTGCTTPQRVTIGTPTPSPTPTSTPSPTAEGTFDRAAAAQFIQLVNGVRATGYTCTGTGRVMPPTTQLPTDPYATQAAEDHAKDMVDNNFFSHGTHNGDEGPDMRLNRLLPAGKVALFELENILGGPETPSRALGYFLASTHGHCESLLDPQVNAIGVASYNRPGTPMGGSWVVDLPSYLN